MSKRNLRQGQRLNSFQKYFKKSKTNPPTKFDINYILINGAAMLLQIFHSKL